MLPTISVLIPVYNAGKYLAVCLESVSKQRFTDFEIVCLDDGSTDHSLNLLRVFQKNEPRLRVFTQANAGVAITRNRLIEYARGEYIAFVDADDLISPDYLSTLYQAAQASGAEITKCFFKEISEDGLRTSSAHCGSLFYEKPSNTLVSRFRCGYYDSVVWGKLFLRQWLHAIKISFLEGRIAEDLPFVVQAFMEARKIEVVSQSLYFYRKGLSMCITAQSERMVIDQLKNLLDLQHILQERSLWEEKVALQWVKMVIWRICAFRKLPVVKRKQYLSLQKQAFYHVENVMKKGSWQVKLRWGALFVLVRLCGWKSVYMWTKIFR